MEAILQAGRGEPRIDPAMAHRMLGDMTAPDAAGGGSTTSAIASARCSRCSRAAAATARSPRRLFVTEATVKTHVRHILEKLRIRNRAEAAAFAARYLDVGRRRIRRPPAGAGRRPSPA